MPSMLSICFSLAHPSLSLSSPNCKAVINILYIPLQKFPRFWFISGFRDCYCHGFQISSSLLLSLAPSPNVACALPSIFRVFFLPFFVLSLSFPYFLVSFAFLSPSPRFSFFRIYLL